MMCTNFKIDGKIQLVRWTLIALSESAVWGAKDFWRFDSFLSPACLLISNPFLNSKPRVAFVALKARAV
jgi:hypothetical protein